MTPFTTDLNLRDNNPYSVGVVFQFPEGDVLLDRPIPTYKKSINDRTFTVEEGDTIWNIAMQAYDESKEYWLISDTNAIDWPFELEVGTTLLIPDLNTFKAGL